jgi:hypothetical protein
MLWIELNSRLLLQSDNSKITELDIDRLYYAGFAGFGGSPLHGSFLRFATYHVNKASRISAASVELK